MFAVLTRMRKPNPDRYARALGAIVATLTAVEKMDLLPRARRPSASIAEAQKLLRARSSRIYHESDTYPIYEGSIGASPREMRSVLLDAAQSTLYVCLSPLAVLTELDELCDRVAEYDWLQEEQLAGGYHDHEPSGKRCAIACSMRGKASSASRAGSFPNRTTPSSSTGT